MQTLFLLLHKQSAISSIQQKKENGEKTIPMFLYTVLYHFIKLTDQAIKVNQKESKQKSVTKNSPAVMRRLLGKVASLTLRATGVVELATIVPRAARTDAVGRTRTSCNGRKKIQ